MSLQKNAPHIYNYFQAENIWEEWLDEERLLFLDFLIYKNVADKNVVELGSRSGLFVYESWFHGAKKAVGYELMPEWVEKSKKALKKLSISEENCDIKEGLAQDVDFSQFDIALCVGLLYNIPDEDKEIILAKMRDTKESIIEFWLVDNDNPNPSTTEIYAKNGVLQYMPNKAKAEQMLRKHGYEFLDVTPNNFKYNEPENCFYLCKTGNLPQKRRWGQPWEKPQSRF